MSKAVTTILATIAASPVLAHPGAHAHPHDGASWMAVAGALAIMLLSAGLAVSLARAGK